MEWTPSGLARDLKAVAVTLPLALMLGAAPAAAQQQITVGKAVHVSRTFSQDLHTETQLAAHPSDPDVLLGCAMVFSAEKNRYETIAYGSTDGGATWTPTLRVDRGLTNFDPACTYGPDGMAFFASFGFRGHPGGEYEGLVYRSRDGGRTWVEPTKIPTLDRHYVTVDGSSGAHHGRVYVHGRGSIRTMDGQRSALVVVRSADGGATFDLPVHLPAARGWDVWGAGTGAVLSDGTLVLLVSQIRVAENERARTERPSAPLELRLDVVASSDGGTSFSAPVRVSDWRMGADEGLASLAVDTSTGPFRDRLYVVWPDARSGPSEILISYSADRGRTWSAPRAVRDAPRDWGVAGFMPALAVNKNGVVAVTWYQRREGQEGLTWRPRLSVSFDGGETFLPSVTVAEAAFSTRVVGRLPLWTRPSGGGDLSDWERGGAVKIEARLDRYFFSGGDTQGLAAAADGTFYPFWIDNRTGVAQVWTAPVRVAGRAIPNGSPELAELADVSERVTFEFANTVLDLAGDRVELSARLVNTSRDTVRAPVTVRVLALSSVVGTPKIINSDNGLDGPGAVLDFSAELKDGILPPGDKSSERKIAIGLTAVRPVGPPAVEHGTKVAGVLVLTVKVLGGAVAVVDRKGVRQP